MARDVVNEFIPLYYTLVLQKGNIVKFLRSSESAKELIKLRALIIAKRRQSKLSKVRILRSVQWIVCNAPMWAFMSVCLMIHDF